MPPRTDRVRKVEGEWVEVQAELPDGSGFCIDPVQVWPGNDDGQIVLKKVPSFGGQVQAADLRCALDLIEEETS